MNYFKFYPVGQGLFYAGSLSNEQFHFVYDCGTENLKKYIDSSIDSYVQYLPQSTQKTKPDIDFVVLSHLHRDHFSGLFYLSKKTNIKKVYLPYLGTDEDFIALVLAKSIAPTRQTTFGYTSKAIFKRMLGYYTERTDEYLQIEWIDTDSEFEYFKYERTEKINGTDYWKFILLNRGISKQKLDSLIRKMHKIRCQLGIQRIADLVDKKDGVETIANIYSAVFSSNNNSNLLNNTSTVLLHFPLYENTGIWYAIRDRALRHSNLHFDSSHIAYSEKVFGYEPLFSSATILTGDVTLDDTMAREIRNALSIHGISQCGVLQVPHHGSHENWVSWKNTGIESHIYAISYGLGNQYRHPSSKTINDLILDSKRIQLVNQIQDFEYSIP